MSRIRVTIDELVLRGLDARDRAALVDGLRSELTRILADPQGRDTLASSRRTPVMRLGRLPLQPGAAGGREFGMRVAGSIGKGLKS